MIEILKTARLRPESPSQTCHFLGCWDFSIRAGDAISLSAPSGAGKSVFLKTIAGLYPPNSGEIFYRNKRVDASNIRSFRANILYHQQNPHFWPGNIEDNIQEIQRLGIHKGKNLCIRTSVSKHLHDFNLSEDLFTAQISELSGGERQLLKLLLGLATEPSILILDEPTASLDPQKTELVELLIKRWKSKNPGDRAYIWVSHSQEQLLRVAHKHFSIDQSRLCLKEAKFV